MKKKSFSVLLFILLFLSSISPQKSADAQAKRNVISSCRAYIANLSNPTKSYVDKGKCIVRTRIERHTEGDFILVEVVTPWNNTWTIRENDQNITFFRLSNNSKCSNWSPVDFGSEDCFGELWYGKDEGWGYLSAGEYEENGNKKFTYNVGNLYSVIFDGQLPRPTISDNEVDTDFWINELLVLYPNTSKLEIEALLESRYKDFNYTDISFNEYVKAVYYTIFYQRRYQEHFPTLKEGIDGADYAIGNPI